MSEPARSNPRVCFLGSTSYTQPLSETQHRKWSALRAICEPSVVALSNDLMPRRFREEADFYLLPAIPLRIASYGLLVTAGALVGAWVLVAKRIDIVVAQGPYEGVAAVYARAIAKLLGRRTALVVESHGNFETAPLTETSRRWDWLYRRVMRSAARLSLRSADTLRAVSKSLQQQLRDWGCTQPIVLFRTWTAIELFVDSPLSGSVPPRGTVMYAGVVTPRKGLEFLLEGFAAVAADFPDARLRIVGPQPDQRYAMTLRRLASDLKIDNRVSFVGEVTQTELAEHLAGSTFLVLPSLAEGLPRVIFEAMAMGRAVVASNVDGNPELVEDGRTGFLVPARDSAALGDRVRWLFTHWQECAAMGLEGRTRVRDLFSTANYLRGYAELFDQALRSGAYRP